MDSDDLERKDAPLAEEKPVSESGDAAENVPETDETQDPFSFASFERYEFKMNEPVVPAPEAELPPADEIAPLDVDEPKGQPADGAPPSTLDTPLPVETLAPQGGVDLEHSAQTEAETAMKPKPKSKKTAGRKRTTRKRTDKPKATKKSKPRTAGAAATGRKTMKRKSKA
jgi:hypothetical protein